MLQIRSLLVPVDFSSCSDQAADWAVGLAARFGSKVTLLHVVELPAGLDRASLVDPTGTGGVAMLPVGEWAEDSARTHLSRVARRLQAAGVAIDAMVRDGAPVRTILAMAEELRPDAIVMGTHGRKGLAHAFMGSVAERVVRAAPCPVITLRADCDLAENTEAPDQARAEVAG